MMERHREKERKDIVGKKNCTQKWESRVAKIYDKNIFSKKTQGHLKKSQEITCPRWHWNVVSLFKKITISKKIKI